MPQRKEAEEKKHKKGSSSASNKEKGPKGDKKEGPSRSHLKDKKPPRESNAAKNPRSATGPTRRLSPGSGSHDRLDLPPLPGPRGAGTVGNVAPGVKASGNGNNATKDTRKSGKKQKSMYDHLYTILKLFVALVFAAGYAVGVSYLFMEIIKAKSSAAKGEDTPACSRLQCPADSVCVDHSQTGHAMCSENSYQNLQILQIVLGIVVGVPSVICLPCTLQWLVRTGGPWLCGRYMEKRRQWRVSSVKDMQKAQSREVSTESPRADDDLEPDKILGLGESKQAKRAKTGLMTRLLCWRWKAEATHRPEGPDSATALGSAVVPGGGAVDSDDDMAEFFAPAAAGSARKKEQDNVQASAAKASQDDVLDAIFASKRNDMPNLPPPLPAPDDGLAPPDEDLRDDMDVDDLFASVKVRRDSAVPEVARRKGGFKEGTAPDEQGLDDFFHRPPNREPPERQKQSGKPGAGAAAMPSMPSSAPARQRVDGEEEVASRTAFSVGLSAIFASGKQAPAQPSRCSGGSSLASSAQEDEEYFDDEDEETGEAPDFIGFALSIARTARGTQDDDESVAQGSDIFATDPLRDEARDDRSDVSGASGVDSLAGLEDSELKELWHAPV